MRTPSRATIRATAAGVVTAVATLFAHNAFAAKRAIDDFAGRIDDTAGTAGLAGANDPASVIGAIIGSFMGFIGILLVCYIIYGGYLWMTAQGSDENIKKAKAIIKNAVIGMVLMFASYAIVTFVLDAVYDSGVSGEFNGETFTEEGVFGP